MKPFGGLPGISLTTSEVRVESTLALMDYASRSPEELVLACEWRAVSSG
jgi:hypothetical protein